MPNSNPASRNNVEVYFLHFSAGSDCGMFYMWCKLQFVVVDAGS